jgi:S1-C subfamily serine protease
MLIERMRKRLAADTKFIERYKGVLTELVEKGAAEKAGLKVGDVLLTFDGQKSYKGRLLFMLLAAVGHPVYV